MSRTITQWGRQCKAQMALQGISLKDLAKTVDLSHTYVSAVINGRMVAPAETTEKISKALDIPVPKVPAQL